MPTRSRSFAKWMYKDYQVVAVKPLSRVSDELHLLDILVKEKGHPGQRPVLEKVGSMLDLGISEDGCMETTRELRENLEKFQRNEGCKIFSRVGGIRQYVEEFSSASCLAGSLLSGVVDAELNLITKGKGLAVKLESVATLTTDRLLLEDIIKKGDWKPDTENNRLKKGPQRCLWFPGTQRRGRKMWLVLDLLYASKVDVSSIGYSSRGGQLAASPLSALIFGPTPGAGLTVHRAGADSLYVDAPPGEKIMIGFRAISFRFAADGNICDVESNTGGRAPEVRDADTDNSFRSHIRGLFLEKPPKEEEEEEEDEDEVDEEEDDDDEDDNEDDSVEDEEWDVQVLDIRTASDESDV